MRHNHSRNTTLPQDNELRKLVPLYRGLWRYFPAALAGVAKHSYLGNQRHNPGEDMHHARGKSTDHEDCILRHLMDLADMLARGQHSQDCGPILSEVNALAWRALALSQKLHEQIGGAPIAPGARVEAAPTALKPGSFVMTDGPPSATISPCPASIGTGPCTCK